ncbi:MAG: Verru_Chthon cassette protein A [Verrucomicrobiota bacterium]
MTFILSRLHSSARRRAFALVLVLAFLALMMVVLVALLNVTTTESKTTHSAAESARVRRMASSTVALALAQLRQAIEPASNAIASKVWTSQPGAIRVHRATGELDTLYKLYSAASMTAGAEDDLAADLPPTDWSARSSEFVDLNAPEQQINGLYFPIIDPRAMSDTGGEPVEGFSYTGSGAPTGTVSSIKKPDEMRLPMPVRWIYMLEDGTLGTLNADQRFVATRPSSTAGGDPEAVLPTTKNPIVARFAFWVDDESCKINVNTASEGAFWDTPRVDTPQDRQLALNQPTRLEYHRQPGHPAGVCLSSVLLPEERFHPRGFDSLMKPMSQENVENLWRLGRLWVSEQDAGTSEGGMVAPALLASSTAMPQPRTRQQRYSEVNEMIFDSATSAGTPGQDPMQVRRRQQPFFGALPAARTRLRQAGGFLTAHSAAPETTLYGTPRITLWPVHQNTPLPGAEPEGDNEFKKYTAYDSVAVLASTLKEQRYLVQRAEPGNGAMDMDIHSGGQNKKLLNYLRSLTDKPVPGFVGGGSNSFAAKYGADPITGDRDSILISMMDYVRSTNFADGQLKPNTQFSILCPGPGQEYHGFGQVSPLQNRVTGQNMALSDHARGPGRVMTVSEVALVIVCRAEAYLDSEGEIAVRGDPTNDGRRAMEQPGDREYEVGFVVEGFLPTQGWTDYRPFTSIALVGGAPDAKPDAKADFPPLKLNGKPVVRSKQTPTVMEAIDDVPAKWRGWGGTLGTRALSNGALSLGTVVLSSTSGAPEYEPPNLSFEGAGADQNLELKLCVYDSPTSAAAISSSAADLLHVIPVRLPDIIVAPDAESAELRLSRLPQVTAEAYSLSARQYKAGLGTQSLLMPEDIVQSLIPAHADYRLLSARRWLQSRDGNSLRPLFVTHPQWGQRRHAHSLRDPLLFPEGMMPTPAMAGHFISNLSLPPELQPDFTPSSGLLVNAWTGTGWRMLSPHDASDALRLDGHVRGTAWPDITGDFDNGVGNCPDGAYTARPDDGNWAATLNPANSNSVPYFDPDAFSQTGHTVPPVTGAGFSAQRMIPSPVAFGSLPTGVRAHVPWQTLLFRPQPGHYGATNPPDHLMLDLFWSPVIEPEPVSRPFETSGKINLNHHILPFSHIRRATALHAVMKAETLMAIPDSAAATYKTPDPDGATGFRHYLDAAGTLRLWQREVFDKEKVFLTPGQICEHPLVPEGVGDSLTALQTFWSSHRLTGDNTKERPYAHLYSRLTTRSNVYRVHFVAETLKKVRHTNPEVFNLVEDQVTARTQGTRLIRRYLDPKNPNLPDYLPQDLTSAPAPVKPLDLFYEWIVEP